ncbi:MAG: ABC transporter ATP-binding protein [Lentihominibacter sp.]|jgi:ABC-2 type transport system ATP-binding protein
MKKEILLECTNLTKNFSGVKALDCVDLKIGRGKIIGLLGPNASGKTTLIKIINGLLVPTLGDVMVDGEKPGPYTKSIISYLPDKPYFADWMKVKDLLGLFGEFYEDFDRAKAEAMCASLGIGAEDRIKSMSKGTREKVQLILVMSRRAELYLLDEPIAGVDPAARDFILSTIINNYNEEGTVIISTHLISEIERILDEVIFLKDGRVVRHETVDAVKEKEGKSIDELFREIFRMVPVTAAQGLKEEKWVYRDPREVIVAAKDGREKGE